VERSPAQQRVLAALQDIGIGAALRRASSGLSIVATVKGKVVDEAWENWNSSGHEQEPLSGQVATVP